MSTEAVERSSIWTDAAVLPLIRILADEKILQQFDLCSKKADLREDGQTMYTSLYFLKQEGRRY